MGKSHTGEHPIVIPLPSEVRSRARRGQVKSLLKQLMLQPLRVPFMNAQAAPAGENKSVNTTRVLEALIIAALTSLGVYIVSIPKLEAKIDNLTTTVSEIKVEMRQIKADFYVPSTRTSQALQTPQGNYYYVPKSDIKPNGQ